MNKKSVESQNKCRGGEMTSWQTTTTVITIVTIKMI